MTQEANGRAGGLFERELELGVLERAVERATQRAGGAVVIEGPAGIGKTSLLGRAREFAAASGLRVVGARGAELESRFPYGVVRQFFESFLFTVEAEERGRWMRETGRMAGQMFGSAPSPTNDPADEFSLLHSLYWMCVNIADERPLMMVLDDAQWADPPSLGFVEFACRRLERLPWIFVIATRVPDEQAPAPLVTILAEPSAEVLRPAALSIPAVEQLVRAEVDPAADSSFARACHEVTRGNPFLLKELVHEVVDEQVPTTAAAAARVREIGPRGVARVVLLRFGRLPDAARSLAAALSVAGEGLSLRELAKLADLDEATAADAAAGLEAAEIVKGGLRFSHPVVSTAVYADLPAVTRARLHRRVADIKAARDWPAEAVATHLLHVEPASDQWVVETLRRAARRATAAGDHAEAERLLGRALREPPDEGQRAELVAELGGAQARIGNPDGARHLREAASIAPDPARSASISIELANVLKFSLQAEEAADVLLDAIERLPEGHPELERQLHAELLGTRFISPMTQERIKRKLASLPLPDGEPRDLLDSFLVAAAAFDAVATLAPVSEAVELGRRSLAGDVSLSDVALGGQALIVSTVALIWAEDFESVRRRLSDDLAAAQAAGSALAVGNFSTMRAMCNYRAGLLLEAEADAATTLELAREATGLETLLPPAVAYAVLTGLERDADLATLRALAHDEALDRAAQSLPYTQLLWARGELALVLDEPEEALGHFIACDLEDPGYGGKNPAMVPWREGAAVAHSRLGDRGAARDLAADSIARATRFGARRALGYATRAAALVEEGDRRLDGLRHAVELLERAGVPLELARARCDLGAALRAAGRRTEAQEVLERAHALAGEIGATRIGRRAADELTAAGVKPRRELVGGVAALTPSERRVAELAASGKTNREIAQSLFVTEKTVETHLGHVYDKLGVRSRRKLVDVLDIRIAA